MDCSKVFYIFLTTLFLISTVKAFTYEDNFRSGNFTTDLYGEGTYHCHRVNNSGYYTFGCQRFVDTSSNFYIYSFTLEHPEYFILKFNMSASFVNWNALYLQIIGNETRYIEISTTDPIHMPSAEPLLSTITGKGVNGSSQEFMLTYSNLLNNGIDLKNLSSSITFTFYQIMTGCGSSGCVGNGEDYQDFNLYHYYLSDDVNELPTFNSSFSDPMPCLNTTEPDPEVTTTLTVSANDSEHDQIFYSFQNLDVVTDRFDVNYQARLCVLGLLCMNIPDQSYQKNVINRDNAACPFVNETTNMSQNFIIYDPGYKKQVLKLSNSCSGEKVYTYELKTPLVNIFYHTKIIAFTNGEEFNLTFYNAGFSNITTQLRFKREYNNTLVYDYWDSLILNVTSSDNADFYINENSNNSNILNIQVTGGLTNYSKVYNDSSYYAEISYYGNMGQEFFYYLGSKETKQWVTTNSYPLTITDTGYYCLDYFVTDQPNKDLHYGSGQSCVLVRDCKYSITPDNTPLDLWTGIGNKAIQDYLNKMGVYEKGKTFLWFLWLGLLIAIVLGEYFFTRSIDITFGLIGSSLLCLILSFLAGYIINLGAFIILTALGLAAPIVSHYSGGRK